MSKSNQSCRRNCKVQPVKKPVIKTKVRDLTEEQQLAINPINQNELAYFKGVVDISNMYAKVRQQYSQYEMALNAVKKNRTKVKTGEYKSLSIPVSPDTTTTLTDKAKMLKYLNGQIKQLETGLLGIKGQMENKRDTFVEYGLRLEAFVKQRFGSYRIQQVASDGSKKVDERKLFEAEFDKLMKDEEKQKEFKTALNKAKKSNKVK